jgi:hypothetical protein
MKRFLVGWAIFTAFATVALVLAHLFAPGRIELELDIYILAVGGLALLEIVLATRDAFPLEKHSALAAAIGREPTPDARPAEIERIERELTLATGSAFDLHARLRPTLREIAGMRMAQRGLSLDRDGEEVLGEELWGLVRPDRKPPTNRHEPGISREALRHAIERVEAL